ncbi:MAG: hypothetical protein M3397_02895 [Actinomycetota bacterium]|jgi:hypothetical protein|nr:hypothetical protein [Rubrobacter sp.]MBA3791196.1 hypothetical protein [Rubrobacter sp.]MDQ3567014.1 hypothetical protein [Actinomycetota bacterium]
MSRRAASWLAWSLWTISVALTALSLVLLALSRSNPDAPVFDWWLGNALVVIDATVGAIVASRRPENAVGWLLCLSGVAVSMSSFTSQYAIHALLAQPGSLPAGEALAWIAAWLLPIMIGLQVFYLLLFPTGRLPGRRWRWLAWMTVAFVVVGVLTSAFSVGAHLGSLGPIRNPLGVEGFTIVWETVLYTVSPLLFAAAALSLFMRLRRAVGVERQQLKWFAYAAAGFAIGIVFISITIAIDTPRWFEWAAQAIFIAVSPAVAISIGIAILRYRLYDIDVIINRTLVYGTLTATLAAIYFSSVVLLQTAFRALTGEGSQLIVVASTLAIATLFNPLRHRIQDGIDRRFYRSKYDAAKTLETFSARLRDETDLDTLNDDLIYVIRETMQPEHVSLWLRETEKETNDR